ncbi:hypothetical protein C4D60_Mb01t18720 [Musa balbisiana]|uniref:Uncharacterized protein n=1 Tax=Musa balbisiana TaxID=52838 RepID=A0A4S8JQB4_MUSBA|nr:hypothetical protein C4D60_Mb01t18720 [Musa balbisiana]
MEEDTDGMASTDRVVILTQVALECIGISGLYDIHSHVVQGLYGLVDGSMLLVIMKKKEAEGALEEEEGGGKRMEEKEAFSPKTQT